MEQLAAQMQRKLKDLGLELKSKELKKCSACGEAVEKDIVIMGTLIRVPVICKCRREELESEDLRNKNIERQKKLDRVFKNSLMDLKFRNANFENWDHEIGNEKLFSICIKYAENFAEAKKNNIGLMIYGPPGNGKTHATSCIANSLLNKGIPVICVSTNSLLDRIKETYNNWGKEGEEQIIRSLSNADLLILDDLGTEQKSEWSVSKIYSIIDYRYRNELPLIITLNLDLQELEDQYGRRTYDRIIEMCTPVENKRRSIRTEKAQCKVDILKKIIN